MRSSSSSTASAADHRAPPRLLGAEFVDGLLRAVPALVLPGDTAPEPLSQVGFMALGAYTMAILVVKEGWSMWLAAPLGVVETRQRMLLVRSTRQLESIAGDTGE